MYDIVTEDLNNGYKLLVCTDGDQPYSVLAHLSVFVIVNILHIDCLLRDYLDIWNQTLQERYQKLPLVNSLSLNQSETVFKIKF
jgi:hypothetical protein